MAAPAIRPAVKAAAILMVSLTGIGREHAEEGDGAKHRLTDGSRNTPGRGRRGPSTSSTATAISCPIRLAAKSRLSYMPHEAAIARQREALGAEGVAKRCESTDLTLRIRTLKSRSGQACRNERELLKWARSSASTSARRIRVSRSWKAPRRKSSRTPRARAPRPRSSPSRTTASGSSASRPSARRSPIRKTPSSRSSA